mgnify:CR=1 FL=1
MRVGVIGTGAMGQNHIKTYSRMQDVDLVGIADIDRARVEHLSRQYSVKGFTDYNDLLKESLDAISVVVPTSLHKKVGLDVIASGTSLLMEKPIADSTENGLELVNAAEREGVKLMVGHIERFNPAVIKAKELIDSGILGKVVLVSTRRAGPYNPRIRDAGVILDIGVHDVDIISYFYNSRVSEVYAVAGKDIHAFEDRASILMRFPGDRAGIVETDWLTPHRARSFTIIGTSAVAYGDYIEQKLMIHEKDWIREARIDKKEPLTLELESFLKACRDGSGIVTTGEDGVHTLKVAMASIRSYMTRAPVEITPIDSRVDAGRTYEAVV